MSSRTKDGQRVADRGNTALPMSVVHLLKTQDAGYVRTMLQKTRKERERLEMELQFEEGGGKVMPLMLGNVEEDEVEVKRMKFVASRHEQESMIGGGEDSSDAAEEAHITLSTKVSRREAEAQKQAGIDKGRARKKRVHAQELRRSLLEAVRERENDLVLADQELELQRAKMSNTTGGVNEEGIKFKVRDRKR